MNVVAKNSITDISTLIAFGAKVLHNYKVLKIALVSLNVIVLFYLMYKVDL